MTWTEPKNLLSPKFSRNVEAGGWQLLGSYSWRVSAVSQASLGKEMAEFLVESPFDGSFSKTGLGVKDGQVPLQTPECTFLVIFVKTQAPPVSMHFVWSWAPSSVFHHSQLHEEQPS